MRIGVVNHVEPHHEMDKAVMDMSRQLLDGPTMAIQI